MPMPYEIVELPFLDGRRNYKRYPGGAQVIATPEEVLVWKHAQELEQENNRLAERVVDLQQLAATPVAAPQPALSGARGKR